MVSIIIPNYNHAAYLRQRIDSVLNQMYQDFELILLDDCSTDNSRKILESYRNHPKVSHIVYNETNSGSPFKQWVKGLGLAKGDFIWIAESDDYADATFLEKVMGRFATHTNLDVVFTGTTNVDAHGSNIGNTTRIERHKSHIYTHDFIKAGLDFLVDFMPNYCIIRNASSAVFKPMVLTPLVNRVTDFKTIGDFYFWVALCLENRQFGFVAEKLNYMRNHKGNVRQSEEKKAFKIREYRIINSLVWSKRWFDVRISKLLFAHQLKKLRQ
jgi:glycosyltransferase involved in cell wall biosynthesis